MIGFVSCTMIIFPCNGIIHSFDPCFCLYFLDFATSMTFTGFFLSYLHQKCRFFFCRTKQIQQVFLTVQKQDLYALELPACIEPDVGPIYCVLLDMQPSICLTNSSSNLHSALWSAYITDSQPSTTQQLVKSEQISCISRVAAVCSVGQLLGITQIIDTFQYHLEL